MLHRCTRFASAGRGRYQLVVPTESVLHGLVARYESDARNSEQERKLPLWTEHHMPPARNHFTEAEARKDAWRKTRRSIDAERSGFLDVGRSKAPCSQSFLTLDYCLSFFVTAPAPNKEYNYKRVHTPTWLAIDTNPSCMLNAAERESG